MAQWQMLCWAVQLEARARGEAVMVSAGATGSLQEHEFGWRDAMDIIVKWRQISEPNDQVRRRHPQPAV